MNEIVATSNNFDADYWALPSKERLYVNAMKEAVEEVMENKKSLGFKKAVERAAFKRRMMQYFSFSSIRDKYYAYVKSGGNWRVLCRLWTGRKSALPQEFKDWILTLAARTDRYDSMKSLVMSVKRMWLSNVEIPGYGEPRQWWAKNRPTREFPCRAIAFDEDFPTGWTDRNIHNILPKQRTALTIAKRGFVAAHGKFRAQLLRDTSKLKPMQLITFDDVRLDIQALCDYEGRVQPCYVHAIFALDVGTRKIISWLIKPRLERSDGSHMGLDRADTKALLLGILGGAIPRDYKMRFLMENASATLEVADRNLLQSIFRDNIEFKATGLTRFDLIKSCGFIEKGGQPWWKGWIEALFRKLHTIMNLLPGTTGNRYDNKPGELESKCKYCLQVLRAAKKDGVDFKGLSFPLLTYDKLELVMNEIVGWLNNRSDHHLQGLDMVDEFVNGKTKRRIGFKELESLNNEDRIGWICKSRPETPSERWNKLVARERFSVLPQGALLPLYDKTRLVTVHNGRIEITDGRFSNERLIFTAANLEVLTREGEVFTAGIPESREFVNLWARDGSFAGSVPRLGRIDILDDDAILEAAGEVSRARENEHFAAARKYRAEEAAAIIKGKLFNEATLPSLAPAIRKSEQKELGDRPQMLKRRERTMDVLSTTANIPCKTAQKAQAERFARQAAIARQNDEDIF